MPTYTYHCDNCDHEFDQHQSFSEEALKICPTCEAEALYKIYKPARVVFKGSGFYVNDSQKASKAANLTKSDKQVNGNGESETKSETKAESKTETKSEKKESSKAEVSS